MWPTRQEGDVFPLKTRPLLLVGREREEGAFRLSGTEAFRVKKD